MSNEEFIKELNQGDLDLLENDLKTLFSGKIDPKDEAEILSNSDQKERILGWWDAARISGIKDKLLGKEQELAGLKQVVDNYLRNKKQTTTLSPEQAKSRVEFLKRLLTKSSHPSVLELPEMVDILVKLNLSENDAIDLIKETFGKELGIEDVELASYLKEIRSIDQYVDRQTFDKNQKLDLKMFIKNNVLPSVIKAKTVVKDANSKQIAEVIARVTAPNNLASDAVYRTIINYPYKDFYEQSVQTMFLNKHSNNSQITALFQRVSDYGIGKVKDKVTDAVVKKFITSEIGGKILSQLGVKVAAAATGTAVAPVVGTIIAVLGSEVLSRIKDAASLFQRFVKKSPEVFGAITVGASFIPFGLSPILGGFIGFGGGYILKGGFGEAGASFARGVNTLSTGLVEAVGTEIVWPIVAIIIATPIVIALILFIITNSALVVPYSSSEYFGDLFENDGLTNKSSCPIIVTGSAAGSYNPITQKGHGSNEYWRSLYSDEGSMCKFSIPSTSGCQAPTAGQDNVCYKKGLTQCDFYGFAMDISSSVSNNVSLPQIDGKDVKWNFNGIEYEDPGVGWTYGYADETNKYSILLKHVNRGMLKSDGLIAGTKLGSLYNQGNNTHLHLEVQVDGRYVRPENYFCNK